MLWDYCSHGHMHKFTGHATRQMSMTFYAVAAVLLLLLNLAATRALHENFPLRLCGTTHKVGTEELYKSETPLLLCRWHFVTPVDPGHHTSSICELPQGSTRSHLSCFLYCLSHAGFMGHCSCCVGNGAFSSHWT